jgi:hypothetical protein
MKTQNFHPPICNTSLDAYKSPSFNYKMQNYQGVHLFSQESYVESFFIVLMLQTNIR